MKTKDYIFYPSSLQGEKQSKSPNLDRIDTVPERL